MNWLYPTQNAEAETDEFKDAIESAASTIQEADSDEGSTSEKTFDVSDDEIQTIIGTLAKGFPDDCKTLSKDYIGSVASKPYSKDMTVRRPLDYTTEKLTQLLQWRSENAVGLDKSLDLVSEDRCKTAEIEEPQKYERAMALATTLNYGSMYWHGLDKDGRPILWLRCGRMPWYPDVDAQVKALILLADAGIAKMGKGITDFVVISDSNSPPPPNPQFMISLLQGLVKGYPDRLHMLISAPVGSIIQFVMKLLLPLMPGRLAGKIILVGEEETNNRLGSILQGGEADIPTFLGGSCDHDTLYPVAGTFPNRNLKFDYARMVKRLKEAVDGFDYE